MSAARDEILGRVRAAFGSRAASPAAKEVGRRLADGAPHVIPARARGAADELVARFIAMAGEVSASVARVEGYGDVPGAVARQISALGLARAIVCAPGPPFEGLAWADSGLAVRFGPAAPDDAVSVTGALAGVAETGSLMVRSGATRPNSLPASPNTLHFLPEVHIAVLARSAIVGAYEDAWARARAEFEPAPPRIVTLITGPSRSSDIERTVAIGVHGPRRLHILVVDGA
jgi:L-lactate dehydrogenase complex protein LldG